MFCIASAQPLLLLFLAIVLYHSGSERASAVETESAGLHIRGLDYNLFLIPNI